MDLEQEAVSIFVRTEVEGHVHALALTTLVKLSDMGLGVKSLSNYSVDFGFNFSRPS